MKTEWKLTKGKADEMHEVCGDAGKVALVFELSDAKRIIRDHNSHEDLIEAVEALLVHFLDDSKIQYCIGPASVAVHKAQEAIALAKGTR